MRSVLSFALQESTCIKKSEPLSWIHDLSPVKALICVQMLTDNLFAAFPHSLWLNAPARVINSVGT